MDRRTIYRPEQYIREESAGLVDGKDLYWGEDSVGLAKKRHGS